MILLHIAVLLSMTSLSTQAVGGGTEILKTWDGSHPHDDFGYRVSRAGDSNQDGFADVLISADLADSNGLTGNGSVYLYSGVDGTLLHRWDGAAELGRFGSSLATAGDFNQDGVRDLLIGALSTNLGLLSEVGAAFAYSGADYSLLFPWHGNAAGDLFGSAVAGIGDVNQDGIADVLIGAPGSSPGGLAHAGSAFVYSGSDGSLLRQWNGTAADMALGSAVAASGDVDQDGVADLILAAPHANPGGRLSAGSVFLYSGATGALLHRWDGDAAVDEFGSSVATPGDLNRDGINDFLIGAPAASFRGLYRAGVTSLYSGADGSLLAQWGGEDPSALFGEAVAGAGDVNADGVPDFLIGASNSQIAGPPLSGAAYLYSGADGSLIRRWTGRDPLDLFGTSVSGAGDTNGDGLDDVLIGAPWRDSNPLSSLLPGAAFLFSFHPYLTADATTLSASSGGTIRLALAFPLDAAFQNYRILISATGTGPTGGTIEIPLSFDRLTRDTLRGIYPLPAANMHGRLDSSGKGQARLSTPPGLPAGLVGRRFYLAAVANPPGRLPSFSSTATTLRILP